MKKEIDMSTNGPVTPKAKMSDEEFTVQHWVRAEACPHRDGKRCCISLGGRTFTRTTIPDIIRGYSDSEPEAWAAAAEFTRGRMEQIRQIEEEIALLHYIKPTYYPSDGRAMDRVIAREQDALTELKRGMRHE